MRELNYGIPIRILWHKSFRYYRREAAKLIKLVEEYSAPNIGAALGLQGEAIVLDGFARFRFLMEGRHTNEFGGKSWTTTNHNLDFIFSRNDVAYGVEVKNTLGYMEYDELQRKLDICDYLNVRPVFAVRMLPRSWAWEIIQRGGYALVLKYQFYPWSQRELAKRVAQELGLPVDSPPKVQDGTMKRFLNWHQQHVNSQVNSPNG